MNLKAGYLVDSIFRIINEHKSKLDTNVQEDITKINQLNGLLSHVSSFYVELNNDITPDFQNINPVLATINNIITRGLPTKGPVSIEKTFYDAGLIKDNEEEHEFYYSKTEKNIEFETIFKKDAETTNYIFSKYTFHDSTVDIPNDSVVLGTENGSLLALVPESEYQ